MIDAAAWRSHEAYRVILSAGWTAAMLTRVKKIPKLSEFLGDDKRGGEKQSPAQQRAIIHDLARSLGLKVERHEKPVI